MVLLRYITGLKQTQLVQAFCREKSICRFNATDWEAIHQMDVCPDNDAASGLDTALPTTYFIELAYKCRPGE